MHHPESVYQRRLSDLIERLSIRFDLADALLAKEVIAQYTRHFDRDLRDTEARILKAIREYKAVEARLTDEAIALRPTDRLMREKSSCFSPAHNGVIA